jgi:hypothetical protein
MNTHMQAIIGATIIVVGFFAAVHVLSNKAPRQCIAEKTIAEIVSVSRHETTVKYTDGTSQRVSTFQGAAVGDVKCLAYQ